MRVEIIEKLKQIERDHHVTILLAIESGSRAWGFPSKDSDYDVRFIYAHPQDWYLSVFEKRDVIELPIDPVFDINGWDLKKALQLLRRSNPALLEWLTSPIIYQQHPAIEPLKHFADTAFMPLSSCAHYLSMAKNNFSKTKGHNQVRIKSYLYALRATLCCHWVIDHHKQPPILFAELLDEYLATGELRDLIESFLAIKQHSKEKNTVNKSELLASYLEEQQQQLSLKLPINPKSEKVELFDDIFRQTLTLLAT
ncbi:MAG: nucleotidyltransferase domain-containing protein [Methylococcaceae bacterium]|nr:nucleotidyltransferase domain-containing protein [Methylococcaceae bacterium]